MALVQRYQNGKVPTIATASQPLTGQVVSMPINAVGDALRRAGNVGIELAEKYQRANDARNLLESEQEMQDAQLQFAKWQATHPEEKDWLTEWEKQTSRLRQSFDKREMSDDARMRLEGHFTNWSGSQTLHIQGAALKQGEARATQAAQNTINRAIESGDEAAALGALDTLNQTGLILPENLEANRFQLEQTFKAKRIEKDDEHAAALTTFVEDFSEVEEFYKSSPDLTDDQKTIKIDRARKTFERNKEVAQNRAQSEFYGNLSLRIANNQPPTTLELNQWAADGKMDKVQAAQMIEAYERGTPAPADKFNDLINTRVLTYDPTKDVTGAEYESIVREGVGMGMDQLQAQRLNTKLQDVVAKNKTLSGRASNHVLGYGLDRINDLRKAGAFGSDKSADMQHALGAIGDRTKMVQYGLTADQAETLAQLQGPERLKAFREFVGDRYSKNSRSGSTSSAVVPAEYNKLTDWTKSLLERASNSKLEDEDARAASDASGRAAQIQDEYESWFEQFTTKNGRPPNNVEVQKAVGDLTRGVQDTPAWDIFRAIPSMAPLKELSPIRGDEGATTLLPPP